MRYSGLLSLLFCLFVLQVSHGYRQLTHLQPTGILESASPQSFAAAGDRLYFSAFQGRTGLEPWFTDGTTTGTTMLAELTLGSSGSEPSGFVSAGGRLFFSARTDGSQGGSIYVSDGTAAGTTRIPGTENALFFPMAVLKDGAATRMVFFQSVGLAAIEVIDGVAGIPVRYALPGTDDRTFVKASNGTHAILANPEGRHWITDGSSVGTRFLVDLYVGEFGSSEVAWASGTDFVLGLNPFGLPITTFYRTNGVEVVTGDTVPITGIGSSWVVVLPNGFALFQAATEETGPEPFVSDGTLAGTSILVDLVPGEFGSFPSIVRSLVHGKGLFVSSGTQTLYATDGTEAGTVPILSGVDNIRELGMINGDLILANVNYSSHAIYRTDGTAAGTSLLFVGAPLGDFSGNGTFGSRVFFGCAETVATGVQLCSTDGTPAGTGLFKVLNNIDEGTPAGLTSIPSASGTSRIAFTYGRNLTLFLLTHHIAAGTATTESLGVELVARMVAGTGLLEGSIFYNSFGTPGGFSKLDLGTRTVTLLSAESQVTPFASANSHVFAIQGSRGGSRLWTTDGTTEGTFSLGSIGPTFPDAIWNDEFIFYNSTTGELSKSDGTRAGTVPIKPLFPPGTAGFPVAFIPSPSLNALFFVFAETELSLWRTDGTADGTSLASNIGPDSFVSAADVPGVGIFLLTSHFTEGSGLSTTLRLFDGNELTTIRTWEDTDFSVFSAAAQGRLVFTLRFDDGHSELWSSDGTASGTSRIPLPEGTVLPRRGLTSSPDGRVFFIAADPEEGEELWETRGTAESTVIVPGPATPGPDSSAPTETLVADGFLYVVAISPENQRQIYATDVASTHPSASVTASTHPGTSRPIPSTPSRSPSTAPPSNEPSASPSPPETIIAHIFTNENGWLKGGQRFRWGDGSCQTISRKVPTEVPSESSSNEIREQGKSLRIKTNDWSGCGSFYYHRNHNRFLNLTGATELRFWIKSTSMAKVEFEVGRPHHASTHPEQDSDDLKDAVFIPSTNGEWVQGSLSIAHRTQEELERVYGPFLITIFGKGQAFISNIVVVGRA